MSFKSIINAAPVLLLALSAFSLKAAKSRQEFDAVVVSIDDHHQVVQTNRSYTTDNTTYNGSSTASTTYNSNGSAYSYGPTTSYSSFGTAQTNVNTYGTATTNRTTYHISGNQDVVGHKVVLQIPDGRLVTVACSSKYAPHGDYVNRRSCRVPLASNVHVEVWKDNAKMYWGTSIDNSKVESETYKIIGVLPTPQASPSTVAASAPPPPTLASTPAQP
jgi:hypothetical protein